MSILATIGTAAAPKIIDTVLNIVKNKVDPKTAQEIELELKKVDLDYEKVMVDQRKTGLLMMAEAVMRYTFPVFAYIVAWQLFLISLFWIGINIWPSHQWFIPTVDADSIKLMLVYLAGFFGNSTVKDAFRAKYDK